MRLLALTRDPLDEPGLAAAVARPSSGAVVTFVGRVRDHAPGHAVEYLEYEAYPEMVDAVFGEIADETRERFAIDEVGIHHRCGRLAVGEASVVIAVAAAHRGPAFEACRYVIEQIKLRAPIWKKEVGPQGAVWVDTRP